MAMKRSSHTLNARMKVYSLGNRADRSGNLASDSRSHLEGSEPKAQRDDSLGE